MAEVETWVNPKKAVGTLQPQAKGQEGFGVKSWNIPGTGLNLGQTTNPKTQEVLKKLDAESRQKVLDLQKIPVIMDVMRKHGNGIPEDWKSAMLWKMQASSPYATEEQQKVITALNFGILDLTRNLQGARPSDLDTKKIEKSLDAIWKGKKKFYAAMDTVDEIVTKNMENYSNSLSRGYGIDKAQLDDIIGLTAIKKKSNIQPSSIQKQSGGTVKVKW